ncbi:MAG: hypothetical protein HY880_00360 [Deltaproteobacteria bacterium]|nr:hypothetical protein [Deltaproteobacteria bacterium]
MTFWELIAVVSSMATFTGVWLAVYALINNKTLKAESRLVRESLKEESRLTRESLKEESRLTRESIKEESRLTREILDRIEKVIERGFRDSIAVTREESDKTRGLIKTTA